MKKATAVKALGGSNAEAGRVLGITGQAVSNWRDPLTPRTEKKVREAIARIQAKKARA